MVVRHSTEGVYSFVSKKLMKRALLRIVFILLIYLFNCARQNFVCVEITAQDVDSDLIGLMPTCC